MINQQPSAAFVTEVDFDSATPVSSGRMPTFSLDPATASTGYGLEMTGEFFVPAPGPYTFFLSGNNASVLDPLASASDPDDGDALRVSEIDGQPLDADNPVRLASGAEVQLNGDGTLTYQPAPGRTLLHEASDTDAFSFTVSDAGGLSASATAQLQLARQNAAPVAPASLNLGVNTYKYAQFVASELGQDADGDNLRITHVNGTPLVGGSVHSLPSKAQVSLSTDPLADPGNEDFVGSVPFGLRYDAYLHFLFTRSQTGASDAFTMTLTDAAGAKTDISVAGSWQFNAFDFIAYTDSRFPTGAGLGPRTARLSRNYRFAHDVVTYITDRQTGISYGHTARTFQARETIWLTFDLPEGVDLNGQHFFDRFDLELDTTEGDPIYYFSDARDTLLTPLYSTASESFFEASAAINPRWGFDVETVRGRVNYKSGIHRITTDYGGIAQLFSGVSLYRGASPNKRDLEPTFASNITIQGVCRTTNISRFRIENRNAEPVPFTLGSEDKTITVGAGQSAEIDLTYEPKIDVLIREANFGLFASNEGTCTTELDFTVTSLCTSSSFAFVQVRNNHPTDSFTVRLDSLNFPSLRSEPRVIGNQSTEFIQLNTQNINLADTQGQLVVILPGREELAETFTFSSNPCD